MAGSDIVPGQIVRSKAGRDKDRYFIVIEIPQDEYVLIADGDLRKIEKPKRKKKKHLIIHDMVALDINAKLEANIKISNSDIRNSLNLMGLVNQSNSKEV